MLRLGVAGNLHAGFMKAIMAAIFNCVATETFFQPHRKEGDISEWSKVWSCLSALFGAACL